MTICYSGIAYTLIIKVHSINRYTVLLGSKFTPIFFRNISKSGGHHFQSNREFMGCDLYLYSHKDTAFNKIKLWIDSW